MPCPCCSHMPLALKTPGESECGGVVHAVAPMLMGLQGNARMLGVSKALTAAKEISSQPASCREVFNFGTEKPTKSRGIRILP